MFLGIVCVLLCMLFRASDVIFRSESLSHYSVLTLISLGQIIATTGITIILLLKSKLLKKGLEELKKLRYIDWIYIIIIGSMVSIGGIVCFSQAFLYINPAIVILLQKLQPVIVIGLSTVFLKERFSPWFYIFSFLGIVSAYFLSFGFNPIRLDFNFYGITLSLLSVIFWGVGTVIGKKLLSTSISSFNLTVLRYYVGTVFILSIIFIKHLYIGEDIVKNISDIFKNYTLLFPVIYMALVSGGLLSLYLYYIGLNRIKASLSSVLELSFPILSIVFSWIFLGYSMKTYEIVFSVLLLLFMGLASLFEEKRN